MPLGSVSPSHTLSQGGMVYSHSQRNCQCCSSTSLPDRAGPPLHQMDSRRQPHSLYTQSCPLRPGTCRPRTRSTGQRLQPRWSQHCTQSVRYCPSSRTSQQGMRRSHQPHCCRSCRNRCLPGKEAALQRPPYRARARFPRKRRALRVPRTGRRDRRWPGGLCRDAPLNERAPVARRVRRL